MRLAEQVRVIAEPMGTVLTSGVTDTDRITGAEVAVGRADRDVINTEVDVSCTDEGDGVGIGGTSLDNDVAEGNK